jgi:hypothetical protein
MYIKLGSNNGFKKFLCGMFLQGFYEDIRKRYYKFVFFAVSSKIRFLLQFILASIAIQTVMAYL